jgi:hypothetical protein
MTRLMLFVALALAASGAQAQIYKCVDSNGKTLYLQSPCPTGSKTTNISGKVTVVPSSPAAAGGAASGAAKSPAEAEQAFRKRQQEQQEAQKEQNQKLADAKQKEANCTQARERLAQLEVGGRISRINAQGEKTVLDDDQIEQEKTAARAAVGQMCN